MVMMMLMMIGVIVEQCSWLSPAGQNLPVIAAAVSACTPVSNQPCFFTTVMIMKLTMMLTMMQAGGSDELHQICECGWKRCLVVLGDGH